MRVDLTIDPFHVCGNAANLEDKTKEIFAAVKTILLFQCTLVSRLATFPQTRNPHLNKHATFPPIRSCSYRPLLRILRLNSYKVCPFNSSAIQLNRFPIFKMVALRCSGPWLWQLVRLHKFWFALSSGVVLVWSKYQITIRAVPSFSSPKVHYYDNYCIRLLFSLFDN